MAEPASGPGEAYAELRAGFAAAVSHELRTPLARLLMLLESALLPGAEIGDIVDRSRAEILQMDELIDDVLLLSQLETLPPVTEREATRVLGIADDVVASFADEARDAGVAVVVSGDEEARVAVRASMVHAVIRNLIENAVRHAGSGATLRLRVATRGDQVEIAAADDGVGVAPDEVPRLFERFYRSDRARAARGSGLGLAVVKHVVLASGGRVTAEGEPGRGLTVRCRLPAQPVPRPRRERDDRLARPA